MEYSISISELASRPKIRDDKYPEFLNTMTDKEIEQYYKEADAILDEKKIPRTYPDWNAAQLAQIIDRDILYNLFCLNLTDDNKKTVFIGLTRLDLQKHKENLPLDKIHIYDFKNSSLSREDINKSDIIDFIDNDGTVKNLKHRGATWPLNK